jgi:hypothetical protein
MATKRVAQVTAVTLALNEVQMPSIRQSKSESKLIVEFAESMRNPQQETNVLAQLNAGDKRFNSEPSIRRAWLTVEKKNATSMLGIPAEAIKAAEEAGPDGIIVLGDDFKSPTMVIDGKQYPLCIQLNDTHTPTEYQKQNPLEEAKQFVDKNGVSQYFMKDGKLIFQNSTVVVKSNRKHNIISSEKRVSREELEGILEEGNAIGASAEETLNG